MPKLSVRHVSKSYDNGEQDSTLVLDDISFEVKDGEFLGILGPSGCGKTTLMNIIAGIQELSSGKIDYNRKLRFGYIFQDFAESLLPWKKAWENIAFPLFISGMSRKSSPSPSLFAYFPCKFVF